MRQPLGRHRLGNLVLGIAAAWSIAGFAGRATAGAPAMDGPYIVNDLEAARIEARKTGKPIFVVFRCEQ